MLVKQVRVGSQRFYTTVADNPDAWQKGLGGTEKMRDDGGMLFLYRHPQPVTFWMKGMNYPIDILLFDKNYEVVAKFENCPADGGRVKYSSGLIPIAAALETNRGKIQNIREKDKLHVVKDMYIEGGIYG